MPTVTSKHEPKLQLPRKNGLAPASQKPSASPKPVRATAPDSVQFGAQNAQATPAPNGSAQQPKPNWLQRSLHNTPGVKHVYAGLKGGLKGTFEWPPQKYWIGAVVTCFVTLPLAFLIPGAHLLLIPAYMGTRRVLHGMKQMFTGFTNPDKILNPPKEAAEEV